MSLIFYNHHKDFVLHFQLGQGSSQSKHAEHPINWLSWRIDSRAYCAMCSMCFKCRLKALLFTLVAYAVGCPQPQYQWKKQCLLFVEVQIQLSRSSALLVRNHFLGRVSHFLPLGQYVLRVFRISVATRSDSGECFDCLTDRITFLANVSNSCGLGS